MRSLGAAALLAAAIPLAAAAAERTFTLPTVNGTVLPARQVLRVSVGDVVVVNLASEIPGEFHLHGYRLVATVGAGKSAQWRFTAHATGRYRVEWHAAADQSPRHHGPPLASLEVLPK